MVGIRVSVEKCFLGLQEGKNMAIHNLKKKKKKPLIFLLYSISFYMMCVGLELPFERSVKK